MSNSLRRDHDIAIAAVFTLAVFCAGCGAGTVARNDVPPPVSTGYSYTHDSHHD